MRRPLGENQEFTDGTKLYETLNKQVHCKTLLTCFLRETIACTSFLYLIRLVCRTHRVNCLRTS